jgi:hypothetical protein
MLVVVPANEILEIVRPYGWIFQPAVFFGFFLAAAVAATLYDRWRIREAFVVSFFIGLLLCNFVLPVAPYPFVAWGHFSEPTPETVTYDEIRFVDERGHELKMDDRLTLEFDAVSMRALIRNMLHEYGERKNEQVTRHLLFQAAEYRERRRDPSRADRVRFPHHGLTSVWTPELLDEYGDFVGVRIYEMTFVTSPDGTKVVRYEEEVVFEMFPSDHDRPRTQPSAMPTRSMNRTVLGG